MITTRPADLSRWPANVGDTCGNVFGLALRHFAPVLPANARVLEIGCAEFDALKRAVVAWPEMSFTGIDWRHTKVVGRETRIQGDVMSADFAPGSFDWIFSISAMEHIGLGHYKRDPVQADGDRIAMANAYRWLKPGGWMYLDVPWNTSPGYEVVRTSHRVYDDEAIQSRLVQGLDWDVKWTGATGMKGGALVENPSRLKGGETFYYRLLWLQKGLR